jgi:hypothetical protein
MNTKKPGAAMRNMVLSILLFSSITAAHAEKKPSKDGDDWWSTHMGAAAASKPKSQSPKERCTAQAKDKQGQAKQQFIDRCIVRANK